MESPAPHCLLLACFASTFSFAYSPNVHDQLHTAAGPATLGMKWSSRCPRMDAPPDAAMFAKMLRSGVPVVFKNASTFAGHRLARWANTSELRRRFGHTEHEASVFHTAEVGRRMGLQPWDTDELGTVVLQPFKIVIPLASAIADASTEHVYFLEQQPLMDVTEEAERGVPGGVVQPEMFADLALPNWTKPFIRLSAVNLWLGRLLGNRPKESPLHFDPKDNLLLLLKGAKKFVFFAPSDSAALYPRYMATGFSADPRDPHYAKRGKLENVDMELDNPDEVITNFSPIDINAPNLTRFPRFAQAKPCVCTVRAGDMLFVPAFTWHNVFSWPDAEDRFNIAVNLWFGDNIALEQAHQLLINTLMGPQPRSPRHMFSQEQTVAAASIRRQAQVITDAAIDEDDVRSGDDDEDVNDD